LVEKFEMALLKSDQFKRVNERMTLFPARNTATIPFSVISKLGILAIRNDIHRGI
jgi:hypothetical protein